MARASTVDWIAVEGAFRAGKKSLRDLAADHGITEGAIRARAKKHGWIKDPEGAKRERVKAIMAGAFTQEGTHCAARSIEEEASQDAKDMGMGLAVARTVLDRLNTIAMGSVEPRDLKVVAEANKIAVETIRRIRGLDDVTGPAEIVIDRSYGKA